LTTTTQRLGILLPAFISVLHGRVAGNALAIMHASGLSLPQVIVLHLLREKNPQSIGQLGGCIHLSASATSHLVDRMVEQKLVRRAEDPADRRQKLITLTAKGVKLVDRLAEARSKELEDAIAALDPALQSDLARVLETVLGALRPLP
jgi:DNA-binding MarR family transcriptional regulator